MTDWADFAVHRVDTGDATLAVRVGGAGQPVVLLHGFPQHSLVWRTVMPMLTEKRWLLNTELLKHKVITATRLSRDDNESRIVRGTAAADQGTI